ncbi:MAG: methyltransferase, partial [Duodenibacillus sp.]
SAVGTYENAAIAQRIAVDELTRALFASRIDTHQNFKSIFEFGCGTGLLTRSLLEHTRPQTLWLNDASVAMLGHCCAGISDRIHVEKLPGNAESLEWPKNVDLIASSNTVQWFAKPLDVVPKAAAALRAGGVFALTGFLPGTLAEVTSLTGVGLTYPTADEWRQTIKSRMQLETFLEVPQTLFFDAPQEVLLHLKATGVNSVALRFSWTRKSLQAFYDDYRKAFKTHEGQVRLTYNLWIAVASNPQAV